MLYRYVRVSPAVQDLTAVARIYNVSQSTIARLPPSEAADG